MPKKSARTKRKSRPFKRRRGKGFRHRSIMLLLGAAVALYAIISVIRYTVYQVSLLFNDYTAIDPIGWMIILLLIIMVGGFSWQKTRQIKRTHTEKVVYEQSLYYQETGTRFKTMRSTPGAAFEYETSKALKDAFPETMQWVNAVLKRKNALNEYAEIDLILFHESGLYLIECKDYNGYVYGGLHTAYWTVGYETRGFNKTYEFQNPIRQNANHIADVKAHIDAVCHNSVLFSKGTAMDTDLEAIETLESLQARIEKAPPIYSKEALLTMEKTLRFKRCDTARANHIKRIRFNKAKYSQ